MFDVVLLFGFTGDNSMFFFLFGRDVIFLWQTYIKNSIFYVNLDKEISLFLLEKIIINSGVCVISS